MKKGKRKYVTLIFLLKSPTTLSKHQLYPQLLKSPLQTYRGHERQGKTRNCSKLKTTEEIWQLNTTCNLGLDFGLYKGIRTTGKFWKNLEIRWQYFINVHVSILKVWQWLCRTVSWFLGNIQWSIKGQWSIVSETLSQNLQKNIL